MVAQEAGRLGLGNLRKRYSGNVPLHTYFGVSFGGFGLFLLCMGAPWIIFAMLALPASAFLTYSTLTRVNTAIYLYEKGFIQVGPTRKIKFAVRSSDIAGTNTSQHVVTGGVRAIQHVRYMVHLRDGRLAEFGLQYMRDADELYAQIVALHRQ